MHLKQLKLFLAAGLLAWSAAAQNVVLNPGFESGLENWNSFGTVTLSNSPAAAHSGTNGVLVCNRPDAGHGVSQIITTALQPEGTYRASVWVRLPPGTPPQPIYLIFARVDGAGFSYEMGANGTVTSTNWTQLKGGYSLHVVGTLLGLSVAVVGPAIGVDFYTDDFMVEPYDWKAAANARIEQFRKEDARVSVIDAAGYPVTGASLDIKQTHHEFEFGSAINSQVTNPVYAAFFKANFEWAVTEDELLWLWNEPNPGEIDYSAADQIAEFCQTNGIKLRGHCLFYNSLGWMPYLSDSEVLSHISNRIESAVNRYKGVCRQWVVNNESLRTDYYGDRFGKHINSWFFQYAAAQDPTAIYFLNETGTIESYDTEAYRNQNAALIASNAPIGGIGIQAHFFHIRPSPAMIEARLNYLAELGLPLWITEYDSTEVDENIRAETLESLYRTAFSLPSVKGIMIWGFWAGAKWLGPNAAIVNYDWSLNAAGVRYQSLMQEWTTITNGTTDPAGIYSFRGFHGDYDVTITPPGGQPTLRRFSLPPGNETNQITLISHPGGDRPLIHHAGRTAGGAIHFQLTGDAGRNYAIEFSTDSTLWATITNLPNPAGTISFTNQPSSSGPANYFRARLAP